MLLYEFDSDPLTVKLVTVMNQLKSDVDSGKIQDNWNVDQLLDYLQNYDIALDKLDLYNMIKNPPLNKVISNIQGDRVIFKGQSGDEPSGDETENQKVVQQMASDAMK
jgi:hypothetical protein